MKRILLILFALISLNAFSQLQVKEGSFKYVLGGVIDNKLEFTDGNDMPMALIKISTENIPEQERLRLVFTGNRATQIIKKPKTGQMWVYLSADAATFIDIKHPDYGTYKYYLPEELCDYCVYEMVLQYVNSKPEARFLAVSSEPTEADVYIDGKHYGKTTAVITDLNVGTHEMRLEKQGYVTITKNIEIQKGETLKLDEEMQTISSQKTYLIIKTDHSDALIYIDGEPINTGEASKSVNIGTTHTYTIQCNLYHEENGSVTVNERMIIEKTLRHNFGYINVSTTPESGAKVYINGDYLGLSPVKTDKLKSGTHTVRVMKDMYKMKEESFTVTDGQTTNASLNMTANYVNVTVNTDANSDIYVDEEYKGKGKWSGRLSDGFHSFEARKENHRASKKSLELVLGKTETITLDAPEPISGTLDVNSSPMGAAIYVDGKHYGETPNFISDILIGTHTLKLEKQGCVSMTKTITIKENETLTINEKLQIGKEISISTDKSGDKIYVDGNYVGVSPITTNLAFGSHNVKAERDGKTVSKTINVIQKGGDNSVKLTFIQKINGHEYVDLGLSVKWATCNVGANKPEEYGNYYAWGETTTKSLYYEYTSTTYGKSMNDINGNSQYDAATANWGGTWRMPTKSEMEELTNRCTWKWTTQNGVKGYKVIGPNGNSIFLPAVGYRSEFSLYDAGDYGQYWTSTPGGVFIGGTYCLRFNDDSFHYCCNIDVGGSQRYFGFSVRPVVE